MPKSGTYCGTTTLAIAKSQSSAGYALVYLLKRLFSLERLASSTRASASKAGYTQLPVNELEAIKGIIIILNSDIQ